VQLGGPGLLIGLGGGAASSMATGVECRRPRLRLGPARQRGDRAARAGGHRPLLADGRAQPDPVDPRRRRGRLSNALPELVHGGGVGGAFDLAAIPSLESGMSPREIWCNEAQERYVLALCARGARDVRRDLQARALPVRGRRSRTRPTAASSSRTRASATRRSTCRST
jgi:phosphoribosylformylglycinamidine synthase